MGCRYLVVVLALLPVFFFPTTPAHAQLLGHRVMADLGKVAESRWKRQGFQFNGNGQEETSGGSPGCIIHCLTILAKGALMSGQYNNSVQNPIESGTSLVCTKYDEHAIDEVCKSYSQGIKCFEACSDSAMKNITLNGFASLEFVCVQRRKEFNKALPCIGDSCAASEKICKPTCGMIQNGTKQKLAGTLEDLASGGDLNAADLFGVQKTIAENCRYASCYMNCSRPSLTEKCGAEAYNLYEELIWKLISAATHSFAELGLGSVWPQECKAFTATFDAHHMSTSVQTTIASTTAVTNTTSATTIKVPSAKSTKSAGAKAATTVVTWAIAVIMSVGSYIGIH